MTLDWSALIEPEWRQEQSALIRQHLQRQAAVGATPSVQASDPPPTPSPAPKTQGLRAHAPAARPRAARRRATH